jgi:signal transduction histidine kinase
LEPSLRQSAIQLKAEFNEDAEISADLNQLKQAILNLIRNAAESIGRQGTITLRTLPTLIRTGGDKRNAVAVEVEDTGQGIPGNVRKRLFDPFFTTKQEGTGLGLSIAARIAHAHGGVIELGTMTGRGALFRIVLPTL